MRSCEVAIIWPDIYIYAYEKKKTHHHFFPSSWNSKPCFHASAKSEHPWLWLYPCGPLGMQGERLGTSTSSKGGNDGPPSWEIPRVSPKARGLWVFWSPRIPRLNTTKLSLERWLFNAIYTYLEAVCPLCCGLNDWTLRVGPLGKLKIESVILQGSR